MEDSKQQIRKYLPSKRFQIVLGVVLVVILGYLLIRFALPSNTGDIFVSNTENVAGEEEGPTVRDVFGVDTDGDGLHDWEENLWGTDPTVADTDGDGISDAEMVEQQKQESGSSIAVDSSVSQDELGRSLLSTYFALKSAGLSTEETQSEIESMLLTQVGEVGQPNEYTRDDFEVIESTPDTISAYGQAVSSILKNTEIEVSDVSAISTHDTAEEFDSEEAQAEFEQLEEKYDTLVSDFLELSVPGDLAEAHLRVVNALNNLRFNFESFAQQDSDLEILGSVVFSSTNWENLAQALYAMQVYLVQRI